MDNDYNKNSALAIVWTALHKYCEVTLEDRTGGGVHTKNDSTHAKQWTSICEAMAVLKEGQ